MPRMHFSLSGQLSWRDKDRCGPICQSLSTAWAGRKLYRLRNMRKGLSSRSNWNGGVTLESQNNRSTFLWSQQHRQSRLYWAWKGRKSQWSLQQIESDRFTAAIFNNLRKLWDSEAFRHTVGRRWRQHLLAAVRGISLTVSLSNTNGNIYCAVFHYTQRPFVLTYVYIELEEELYDLKRSSRTHISGSGWVLYSEGGGLELILKTPNATRTAFWKKSLGVKLKIW
jgi:hypothetical protein